MFFLLLLYTQNGNQGKWYRNSTISIIIHSHLSSLPSCSSSFFPFSTTAHKKPAKVGKLAFLYIQLNGDIFVRIFTACPVKQAHGCCTEVFPHINNLANNFLVAKVHILQVAANGWRRPFLKCKYFPREELFYLELKSSFIMWTFSWVV